MSAQMFVAAVNRTGTVEVAVGGVGPGKRGLSLLGAAASAL